MIEEMKKLTIVCLSRDQDRSLRILRRLASVHVTSCVPPASAKLDELRHQRDALQAAINRMDQCGGADAPTLARSFTPAQADERTRALLDAVEAERGAEEELRRLVPAEDKLRLWGQFDAARLEQLRSLGWKVALCRAPRSQKIELPQDASALPAGGDRQNRCFMVISRRDLSHLALPVESFPCGMDLSQLQSQIADARRRSQDAAKCIGECARGHRAEISHALERLDQSIAFETTRSGMGHSGETLSYLTGYIPSSRLDRLRQTAQRCGWAVRYEDVPADDPQVPTSLVLPRPFRMARTLLDFIGVIPGYREVDVSVCVLLCLIFFCGMLVGDAGYGLVFTILCGAAIIRQRRHPKWGPPPETLQLLLGMSASILVWGTLSGTWFGLKAGGLPWLANDATDAHIKLFCFFIGAAHLSFARLWKACLANSLREKLGNAGWALFMWGNFFTVKALLIDNSFDNFTVPVCMYLAATVLIVLFSINWRSFGDVIYSPFNFINSISDVLSYIRLYAVGLSSLYIAQAFNDMASSIWSADKWLIPVGLVVLMLGHLLNVALASMSVLVHGIRLNTLEFSGHIGIEWSGRPYAPFK